MAARFRIEPYRVGYLTNWEQRTGVNVASGVLSKVAPDDDWNAGAVSSNVLKSDDDGWLQFMITGSTSHYMIGFTAAASGTSPESMLYGMEIAPGQPVIGWETATNSDLALSGGWQVGDVFAISRVGDKLQYYRNGRSLRTLTTNKSQELKVKTLIYTGSAPAVSASFDLPLVLTVKFTSVKSYGLSGGIAVQPVTGTAPYVYSWKDRNEITSSLVNLQVGTYAVTVKDDDGRTLTMPYDLGYSVLWKDQNGVNGASDVLTKNSRGRLG